MINPRPITTASHVEDLLRDFDAQYPQMESNRQKYDLMCIFINSVTSKGYKLTDAQIQRLWRNFRIDL